MISSTEDKLRKLGCVIGKKISKLQWAWQAESDGQRKKQLETHINLLYSKHFGFDEEMLLLPPSWDIAKGDYYVGAIQYAGKNLYPFMLRENELSQHVLIAGRSGSGKTNLLIYLAKQFVKKQKPFLLFSFKREYRQLVQWAKQEQKNILVFSCGRPFADFHFNPLSKPKGADTESWINLLSEAIADVYFLKEGAISFLRSGLSYVFERQKEPRLIHLSNWINDQGAKGRAGEWLASCRRVLDALCFGRLNEILNSTDAIDLESLLDKHVIIEIDVLNDDDRTFVVQCILRWLYRNALENFPKNEVRYVLFVDEAHHVFKKVAGEENYSDLILRMAREVSLGIILADQHPSLLSLPARGDTTTTITLNLKTNEDVSAMTSSLLLDTDQKKYIGLLQRGMAIVRNPDRFPTAFLIQIPKVTLPSEPMTDDMVTGHMKPFFESRSIRSVPDNVLEGAFPRSDTLDGGTPGERAEHPEIGNLGHAFLMHVVNNPFTPTRERYNQLKISARQGGIIKDKLVKLGYLKPVVVEIQNNNLTLFDLTDKAFEYLKLKDISVNRNITEGGIEHRFGVWCVKNYFEKQGFSVLMEVKTELGKYIDVVARKDEVSIALLVETGKSDVASNIENAQQAGFNDIRIITMNKDLLNKKFTVPVVYLPDLLGGVRG